MSAPQSGLVLCQNTLANNEYAYFVKKGEPIPAPVLSAPVSITSSTGSTTAVIGVEGNPASAFFGAVNLTTGAGGVGVPQRLAITADPTANGVDVYVGADTVGSVNRLQINGGSGLSQVNDGIYNPVVKSAPIFEETFALDSTVNNGVKAITFTVPRTGAYMLQVNINLANDDLIPTLPNNFPGGAIEWTTTSQALNPNEVQYISSTLSADIFTKANQIGPVAEPMDYVFSSLGFFQTLGVGQTYSFNMFALRPLDGGVPISRWTLSSVKVRLIQMC